jgi:hypothetical protein
MRCARLASALLFVCWFGACNDSQACLFAGQHYATGERFSAADGCNSCTCEDGGKIQCTREQCASAVRESDAGATVCLSGNPSCTTDHGCRNGDQLVNFGDFYHDADRCRSCRCVAHGIPVSGSFSCFVSYCGSDLGMCAAGQCDSCSIGERDFALGELVICPDGCNTCACATQGEWVRTSIDCPELARIEACSDSAPESAKVSIAYLSLEPGPAALALWVEHRGGCAEHRFAGCFEPAFLEGSPPVVRVRVADQAGAGETCDVPLREEIVYDVTAIRQRFGELYAAEHGEIAIRTRDDSIHYAF